MPKRDEHAADDVAQRKRVKLTVPSSTVIGQQPDPSIANAKDGSKSPDQSDHIKEVSETIAESSAEPESSQLRKGKARDTGVEDIAITNTEESVNQKDELPKFKAKQVTVRKDKESKPVKIAVQTIIPKPTKMLIDQCQVAPYNEGMLRRIQTLSAYTNKEANVFSLGNILPTATWGVYQPFGDHSKELCNPATNEPVVIWTVGHIASTWFVRGREPDRQASVSVVPLSDSLATQTARLLAELASPSLNVNEDTPKFVRATRWQCSKQSDAPVLFDGVYDAREAFAVKSEMPQYSATDLKKNDLVLLESKITKYRVQGIEKGKANAQRTQMEMIAVSLLFASDQEESSEEFVPRDITGLRI